MKNLLPPSTPYQLWGTMVFLTIIVCMPLFSISLYLTWPLFEVLDFTSHITIMKQIVVELIANKYSTLDNYTQYLITHEHVVFNSFLFALLLLISLISSALFSKKILYVDGGRTLEILSGVRKLEGDNAFSHAKKYYKSLLKNGGEFGVQIHSKISLSLKEFAGNIIVIGSPGSGKTVFLLELLVNFLKQNLMMFIYDPKGEFTELFYQPKKHLIISPADARSTQWNIALDLSQPEAEKQFALNVIPEGKDPFWSNSARIVLAGLITSLKVTKGNLWGWRELQQLLDKDIASLSALLSAHAPSAAQLISIQDDGKESTTSLSILMTLKSHVSWIEVLAIAWPKSHQSTFSIKHWLSGSISKKQLFILDSPEQQHVGGPLCQALMSVLVTQYLSLSSFLQLLLFIDEFPNLPFSKKFIQFQALGRANGGRTIVATQSFSQLQSIYGDTDTNTLISFFKTRVVLAVSASGDVISYLCKLLGYKYIERPSKSTINGKITTNWQKTRETTISENEISHQRVPTKSEVFGFLSTDGRKATYALSWPIVTYEKLNNKFVSAKWLSTPSEKIDSTPSRIVKRQGSKS
jgi:type IV secretory pathway TraG/TraD family ATPase VirD4